MPDGQIKKWLHGGKNLSVCVTSMRQEIKNLRDNIEIKYEKVLVDSIQLDVW